MPTQRTRGITYANSHLYSDSELIRRKRLLKRVLRVCRDRNSYKIRQDMHYTQRVVGRAIRARKDAGNWSI